LRKALPVHHTETSDGPWDGPKNEANLKNDGTESYYKKAFAWQDPDGDPETKAAYKFIHHEVDSDGNIGAANIKACQTGIAVLNGARGGTTIPSADRPGVYKHLAAHLKDAGVEPPELKELDLIVQHRSSPFVSIRVEKRSADSKPRIVGHAAVFNELSEEIWGFREEIAPGAFKESIENGADVRALWNHDVNFVLGRTTSGTLKVWEDDVGLAIYLLPPDTQLVNDLVIEPINRGDVDQMSFGFIPIIEQFDSERNVRVIIKVDLFDVSPVTYPAYPQTDVAVRAKFKELGIDQGFINLVLSRSFRGEKLSESEIDKVKRIIEVLQRAVDSSKPETNQGVGLDVLYRQLELLERLLS